jgi:hypothetical protein
VSLVAQTSGGLPHRSRGSAPALRVSRFARCSLTLGPASSLTPRGSRFLECFSPSRYLLEPLQVLPGGATSYRAGFAPARINTPLHGTRRVGMWRGGLGMAYRSGPFVCRGFTSPTLPRFHSPLVEPDMQISRIRLSDGIRPAAHGPTRRPDLHRRPSPFRSRRIVGGGCRQHGHSPDS